MPRTTAAALFLPAAQLLAVVLCLSADASPLAEAIRHSQERVAKIYGAGGLRQLEAYQTGVVISPEGHVLTFMSHVLDTDDITVVLDDGEKHTAQFVGADPLTELAVLKIAPEADLPCFEMDDSPSAAPGVPVIAVSNLYGIASGDEPVSALQGVITAVTELDARRGSARARYRGTVYLVDAAANNPGAAGGALVDTRGRFLGVLGKELRSRVTGTWLNYALPADRARAAVEAILGGGGISAVDSVPPRNPMRPSDLGIRLVPDVLPRTPPFVDSVAEGSAASQAGVRPDDLVVFVAGSAVNSHADALRVFAEHDRSEEVTVLALRGSELIEFTLSVSMPPQEPEAPQ